MSNKYIAIVSEGQKVLKGPFRKIIPLRMDYSEDRDGLTARERYQADCEEFEEYLSSLPIAFTNCEWLTDSDNGKILEEGVDFTFEGGGQEYTGVSGFRGKIYRQLPMYVTPIKQDALIPDKEFPRRIRLDLNHTTEIAIRAAVSEIEKIGVDVRLTHAVNLLNEARELVADFIDTPIAVPIKQERMFTNNEDEWDELIAEITTFTSAGKMEAFRLCQKLKERGWKIQISK